MKNRKGTEGPPACADPGALAPPPPSPQNIAPPNSKARIRGLGPPPPPPLQNPGSAYAPVPQIWCNSGQ